jgi:hypothetical protein
MSEVDFEIISLEDRLVFYPIDVVFFYKRGNLKVMIALNPSDSFSVLSCEIQKIEKLWMKSFPKLKGTN